MVAFLFDNDERNLPSVHEEHKFPVKEPELSSHLQAPLTNKILDFGEKLLTFLAQVYIIMLN